MPNWVVVDVWDFNYTVFSYIGACPVIFIALQFIYSLYLSLYSNCIFLFIKKSIVFSYEKGLRFYLNVIVSSY